MLAFRNEAGFSLLELLIAMALMGVLLIPLVTIFTNSLRSTRSTMQRKKANQLMGSCLASLRSVAKFSELDDGSSTSCDADSASGNPYSFESPHSDFEYFTEVDQQADTSGRNIKVVNIRVRYESPLHGDRRCITDPDCSDWDASTVVSKH